MSSRKRRSRTRSRSSRRRPKKRRRRRVAVSDEPDDDWVAPDVAPAADLPIHARERLVEMRQKKFFTSDLSINEFLLVKEAGFEPLGLVMGSSIYQIKPRIP